MSLDITQLPLNVFSNSLSKIMMTKAEIKFIRSLSDRTLRCAEGLFVAEGHKLIEDIQRSHFEIEHIFSVGDNVTSSEMERISHLRTPTDRLALVRIPEQVAVMGADCGLTLLLDGVQDPGNMGTIIRLADWFGVRRIYCSDNSVDCWNPKVVQATMGAITRVEVRYGLLLDVVNRNTGRPLYGTFLEGDNIYRSSLSEDALIVMGSEGRGISPELEDLVSHKLFIPPYPSGEQTSESLNVATATAVILSEFRRPSLL